MCIAFGMKVMVTQNVETDLDIANGARGTIVDIWLDPNEPLLALQQPLIKLKYLPVCILVKLEWMHASRLKDLEESVIPVEPTYKPYHISCQTNEGTIVTCTVHRCQFLMTTAYAFTDYCSQGQTIPAVIVDIATPPTGVSDTFVKGKKLTLCAGGLSLFNLYVALSRSSGCQTIRLLRDFVMKVFQGAHCPELLAENDRLEYLNEKTLKEWKEAVRTAEHVRRSTYIIVHLNHIESLCGKLL